MKHLKKKFPKQFELIEERMGEDPDFRRLCSDYEHVATTIDYLATLMAIPRAGLQKQIEQETHVLREMEKDIELFLAAEQKPESPQKEEP